MTKVILHIGMTKTGSSAIQLLLARHSRELAACGVFYAGDRRSDRARKTFILQGNGTELGRYLVPSRRTGTFSQDAFEAGFASRWLSDEHPHSLLSSEMMANAKPNMLARFRDRLLKDRPIEVLAVVRDFYAHAGSAWMQMIKRSAYTGSFTEFCQTDYQNAQVIALRRFEKVFPGSVSVLPFELNKRDLFGAFLRSLGVQPDFAYSMPLVNRSLAPAEIEVLRECNRRHNTPKLSRDLSDYLIQKHPDREKADVWDHNLASYFEEKFSSDAQWVNSKYFGGTPTITVAAPPSDREPRGHGPSVEEVWADINEALKSKDIRLPG